MKLCHLAMAQRAVSERARLTALRDNGQLAVIIRIGSGLGVTEDCDQAMIDLVRPVVAAELDRRIAEIEGDLASYGVELA